MLAFEDSYDVKDLLSSAGCAGSLELGALDLARVDLRQRWSSHEPLAEIEAFAPDVFPPDKFNAGVMVRLFWPLAALLLLHSQ